MQRVETLAPGIDVRKTARQLVRNGVDRTRVEQAIAQKDPTRPLLALCMINGVSSVYRRDH